MVISAEQFRSITEERRLFVTDGVILRKKTNDRLEFVINDNVSTLDQFDIIGYGVKIS